MPTQHQAQPRKILHVEDNDDDAFFVERAILRGRIRHELTRVEDGEAATAYLRSAARDGRRPDLVLLDLKLPRVSGLEVLKVIRSTPELASVPVVVLSASNRPQDIADSYQLGANHYLVKPTEFDEYARLIDRFIEYWTELGELPPHVPAARTN